MTSINWSCVFVEAFDITLIIVDGLVVFWRYCRQFFHLLATSDSKKYVNIFFAIDKVRNLSRKRSIYRALWKGSSMVYLGNFAYHKLLYCLLYVISWRDCNINRDITNIIVIANVHTIHDLPNWYYEWHLTGRSKSADCKKPATSAKWTEKTPGKARSASDSRRRPDSAPKVTRRSEDIRPDSWRKGMAIVRRELKQKNTGRSSKPEG